MDWGNASGKEMETAEDRSTSWTFHAILVARDYNVKIGAFHSRLELRVGSSGEGDIVKTYITGLGALGIRKQDKNLSTAWGWVRESEGGSIRLGRRKEPDTRTGNPLKGRPETDTTFKTLVRAKRRGPRASGKKCRSRISRSRCSRVGYYSA
ncbi:hypothetical protein DENSPDRAFT_872911 [Dentipellis sp. KUC8613]|nr:hypothetical protein DENSPDRAFT_872911 [Dentipellis sp. KUC8613]